MADPNKPFGGLPPESDEWGSDEFAASPPRAPDALSGSEPVATPLDGGTDASEWSVSEFGSKTAPVLAKSPKSAAGAVDFSEFSEKVSEVPPAPTGENLGEAPPEWGGDLELDTGGVEQAHGGETATLGTQFEAGDFSGGADAGPSGLETETEAEAEIEGPPLELDTGTHEHAHGGETATVGTQFDAGDFSGGLEAPGDPEGPELELAPGSPPLRLGPRGRRNPGDAGAESADFSEFSEPAPTAAAPSDAGLDFSEFSEAEGVVSKDFPAPPEAMSEHEPASGPRPAENDGADWASEEFKTAGPPSPPVREDPVAEPPPPSPPEEWSSEEFGPAPAEPEASGEDWGDVAAAKEEDVESWDDVAATVAPPAAEPTFSPTFSKEIPAGPLPLSLGSYARSLDERARSQADVVAKIAAERAAQAESRAGYQRTGDAVVDGRLELLHRELDGAEGPAAAFLLRRIAEVYAEKAHEVKPAAGKRLRDLAKEKLRQAQPSAPEDSIPARLLRQLHEMDEEWEEALAEVENEEVLTAGKAAKGARVECLLAKGRLSERTGDNEKAAVAYRQVLTIDGRNLSALRGLDSVLTRQGQWEPLIDVLEKEAALVQGAEEQAQLQYRLGQILSRFLAEKKIQPGDVAGQVFTNKVTGCFRAAAEKGADPVPALSALRQIYARFGKWEDVVEVSERLCERTHQPAAKIHLLYQSGRIYLERLRNLDGALSAYERILAIDPRNLLALKALEAIYTSRPDPKRLLANLQQQAAAVDDQGQKALLDLRIAKLCEDAGDATQAIEWYSRALEIEPRNTYVLIALGKLHARNKDWKKLDQIYEFEAEAFSDLKQKIDFLIKRAELRAAQFGDLDGAIGILRKALEADDMNLTIYRELGRLLAQSKRWTELIALYEAETTLTTDKRRLVAIYMSLGELWQEDFEAPAGGDKDAKAVESYYQVLETDPTHTPALRALGKLFAQRKDWGRLSEVYGMEVELAEAPAAKVELYVKMAEIEEDQSKNYDRAVFFLRKALEIDPHSKMVLSALERMVPRMGQWDDLLQVYIRGAECTHDVHYVAALHQLTGQLWREQFGLPAKAEESFRHAANLEPGNIVALRSLEDQFEAAGKWADLCGVLKEDLSQTSEPGQKIVLLKRLAEITEQQLRDRAQAAAHYEKILEIEPGNFDALEHAARLFGEMGQWERQAKALDGLLRAAKDPAYLAQAQMVFARVLAEHSPLEDSETKALSALDAVLRREPNNREALDLMAGLLHGAERWDDLAGVLRRRIALDEDDAARAAHQRWLGQALLKGTATGEDAISAFHEALRLEPKDVPTRIEMARACEKAGRHEEAARHYEALRAEISDPDRRRELSVSLAKLQHGPLAKPEGALALLRKVLEEDPAHEGALSALGEIAAGEQNWDEAVDLAERRYALASGDGERVRLLLELARLWDEKKNGLARAAECCSKVLESEPDNLEALLHLGEIELKRGNVSAYCALGERELALRAGPEDAKDAARRHQLHHRLAAGYRDHLNQRKRSREHLQAARALRPQDFDAMKALEKLYEADMMWEELAGAYSYRAVIFPDATERLNLFLTAARVWRDRSQAKEAPAQALREYEKALQIAPDHPVSLTELAQLAQKMGNFQRAYETLEHLAEVLPEIEQPPLLAQAGRIAEEKLSDAIRATQCYNEALRINPNFLPAAEPLAELLCREKQWRSALPLFDRLAKMAFDRYPADRQARFLYLRGLVYENLGQDEQAVGAYQQAIGRAPQSLEAIDALAALYERRRNWKERIGVLQGKLQALDALGLTEARPAVLIEVGSCQEKMKQPREALASYRAAAGESPGHAAALEAVGRISRELDDLEGAAKAYGEAAQAALAQGDKTLAAGCFHERGELLLAKLARPADAARAFENALQAQGGRLDTLHRLAHALYQAKDYPKARQSFERLLSQGGEPVRVADCETHLGRIALDAAKDEPKALQHFERALAADPKNRGAYEALGGLYERASKWDEAVRTYEKFIELVEKEAPRTAAPLHSKLGDLYKDHVQQPEKAVLSLRKAARLDPQEAHPHEQLAKIFEAKRESFAEAVREHAALLALDPFRWESYYRLFSMYEEMQAFDKAFCVARALVCLGQARDPERIYYEAQKERNPVQPKGVLGEADHAGKLFWHPLCQHPAAEIFYAAAPALGRLAPSPLERLGIGKQDRIAPEDASPAGQLLKRLLAFSGNPACEAYVARRAPKQVQVLPNQGKPAVLVGPDAFRGLDTPQARAFAMAQGLWPLVDGSFAVLQGDAAQVPRLVSLLGRAIDEEFKLGGDPDLIKQDVKLIHKDLSRKQKKDAEALVPRLREYVAKLDPKAWRRGALLTADRFGLFYSNSLADALNQIMARGGEPFAGKTCETVKDWGRTFKDYEPVGEILRYSVSEEYFALRQKLGSSILTT